MAACSSRGPSAPPACGANDRTSWSTQRTGSYAPVAPSSTTNRARREVAVPSSTTPPQAPSCHSPGALPSFGSLKVTI